MKLNSKKKMLIVCSSQFGYHTDSYFFSKLLSRYMKVTYLGFHHGKKDFECEDVNVIEVPFNTGKVKSRLTLFKRVKQETLKQKYDYSLIFYFTFSGLLRFFIPDNIMQVIDIRTSFITGNSVKNKLYNKIMKAEVQLFKHLTIISSSLANYLNIKREYQILPLGAPTVKSLEKSFTDINLLYVGTFFDRKIESTIEGLFLFLKKYNYPADIKYTIIGFGYDSDINKIHQAIDNYNLQNYITYLGEVRYPELQFHFDKSNIGVSYIPMTEYYQCQPPTKTFEYLLNGMPVIATATKENSKVIYSQNGELIDDSAEGFAYGVEKIYKNRDRFDSKRIIVDSQRYTWDSIVEHTLLPYLSSLNKR